MELTGYIGTYTKEESKGVYHFTLDTDEKKITNVKLAAELSNPTYLTISEDNKHVYAVSKEGEDGGVAAFAIEDNGDLTKLNSLTLPGSPPCHVSVNRDKQVVLSANYHTKKVVSYYVQEDGSLQAEASVVEFEGSGPHERQEKPHLHFAGFSPDERFAVIVDLGSDQVYTYLVRDGELTKANVYKTKPGCGPRHIAFHPNGKFAYVMTELSSEVIALSYDEENGSFQEIAYYSSIPEDFTETNDASAIHISPDGKFVYAGNRGHSSIAIFKVNEEDGTLTFVDWTSTEGNWPRDFVLDPSGKFVVAVNQKTNDMSLFSRDEESGRLTLLQSGVKVPEPVCVKFMKK